jgi:autotransporter-associated beta strand protein
MCPYTFSLNKPCVLLLIVFSMGLSCFGQSTFNIKWGTHHAFDGNLTGSNYVTTDTGFSAAYPSAFLKSLNADGSLGSDLVDDVDLIQLGFFDTDPTDDSTSATISPNTSTSDLFKGVWTPLSTNTVIAQDWNTGTLEDGVGGEFYFYSSFSDDSLGGEESEAAADWKVVHNNLNSNTLSFDEVLDYASGTPANNNVVDDRVNALITASASNPVMLGIRFYDAGGDPSSGSGSTRYNTIMSTDWTLNWSTGAANLDLLEFNGSVADEVHLRDTLVFEFDNSDANTANVSKVGTSDTQITSNDFVTTITYHDGTSNIDVSSASHVLSGLTGTTSTVIFGGTNGHVVTLNSQSGNTGSDAFDFAGDFYSAASGSDSTDVTIIKTGAGDQILSGNLNLADSTDDASVSGGLNIASGNLILKPASGKTQVVEYLTGAGGLKLDNSGVNNGTIVTLGFANQTSSTFSGTVVLDGNGAAGESKISVSSGSGDDDYNNVQTLSGVVSENGGAKKLVKEGVGALKLSGTNTFTGGLNIGTNTSNVNGGRVIAASSQALGGIGGGDSKTVVIQTGKLEVASGVTLNSNYTINGDADGSGRSFVGGDGKVGGSLVIGSAANQIDVIAPGEGLSTSINHDKKQAPRGHGGDSSLAIGTFDVGTLTLDNGGVYDWEIDDFGGSAGNNWDLLKFDTLNLDTADTFTINILGLDPTTDLAGSPNGDNLWSQGGNQWEILRGNGGHTINWSGGSQWSDAQVRSFFDVRFDDIAYQENMWGADWYVSYNSGSFYLQFSAVPEPSTYMMVTGLLMVPGMSYLRRIRRKKDSDQEETSL